MKTFVVRFLPPLLWMGLIFYVSSLQTLPGPGTTELIWWDYILKKTAHMVEYAILFYLWQRAINWNKPVEKHTYWLAMMIVILNAMSDEFHQSFIPGRHPKFYDIFIDFLGAFLTYAKVVKSL